MDEMTMRDLFAAFALAGILGHPDTMHGTWWGSAREAYKQADAMLKIREEKAE